MDFDDTNGGEPYGSLTLSGDTIYGMTNEGGLNNDGVIFSIQTNGSGYKDLLDFNGTNGANPAGSLILSGSTLYGMTQFGGANGDGVIFSIQTNGSGYNDLFNFSDTNGLYPQGSLILSGSTLYGMTEFGGANGDGVIFRYGLPSAINSISDEREQIRVYPNPNDGVFQIVVSCQLSVVRGIQIYNVWGQRLPLSLLPPIGGSASSSYNIDLSSQPEGVYFWCVVSQEGIVEGYRESNNNAMKVKRAGAMFFQRKPLSLHTP